jgi:hypothetical protein
MSWAETRWPREQMISYVAPAGSTGREPTTTIVDWWTEPPHALDTEQCKRLVELAQTGRAVPSGNGTYHPLYDTLDPDTREALISTVREANQQWWRLETDKWFIAAKRYLPGEEHSTHQDWVPGHSATRKVVGGWQLSPADAYAGGDVVVSYGPHRLAVPRDQGAFYALPCWAVHRVEPVGSGERWSLIVNGYGPPLR